MDAVQEIKARLRIDEIVGQYVELRPSGASYKALCPFHAEKTPSFYVSPARGTYHCFGCGQAGDVLSFVQAIDRLDFRDALRKLADRAGVELESGGQQKKEAGARDLLYAANAAAVEFFRDRLRSTAGERARRYLQARHVSAEAQELFALGYAPATRSALLDYLRQRGFEDESLLGAGLVMPGDGGSPNRDRFHDRLMFPICDARGRITGFGGRVLDGGEPKYLNSPQTAVFDKSQTLFAINLAHGVITDTKRAVVVEGYLDAVRAHAHGYRDVVATLGTAVTGGHLQMLARLAPTVVIALDPDPAGQMAAARAALSALAALPRRQQQLPDSLGRRLIDIGLTTDLRMARLPAGSGDPDELIERDVDLWRRLIESSVPAFEFYFDLVVDSLDRSNPAWRQEAVDRILPVVREFSFAVGTQAAWLDRLSEVTGIQTRLLQSALPARSAVSTGRRGSGPKADSPAEPPVPRRADPQADAERSLLQVLLRTPLTETVFREVGDVRLESHDASRLLRFLLDQGPTGLLPDLDCATEETRVVAQELRDLPGATIEEGRAISVIGLHVAIVRRHQIRAQMEDLERLLPELANDDLLAARRRLAGLLNERLNLDRQIDRLQRQVVAGP